MNIRHAIAESYLARGLDADGLDALEGMARHERYEAGVMIVAEGEPEHSLMVLVEGHAEIRSVCDEPLAHLRPGMLFGEVALLDDKPRSASVVAVEPCDVLVFPGPDMQGLIAVRPDLGVTLLRNLARVLCSRMRASNQQLATLLTLEDLRDNRV